MSVSTYLRLFAASCGVVVVSLAVSAARCDDDEGGEMMMTPEETCADLSSGARFIRFRLFDDDGVPVPTTVASRACAFDRTVTDAGDCDLIGWDFENLGNTPNQIDETLGGQTYFQYLLGQTCVEQFDGQLDYTVDEDGDVVTHNRHLFNGAFIRTFDSGTGPFAVGVWQEVDEEFNILAAGCFDFYESEDIPVVDRVCELPL